MHFISIKNLALLFFKSFIRLPKPKKLKYNLIKTNNEKVKENNKGFIYKFFQLSSMKPN